MKTQAAGLPRDRRRDPHHAPYRINSIAAHPSEDTHEALLWKTLPEGSNQTEESQMPAKAAMKDAVNEDGSDILNDMSKKFLSTLTLGTAEVRKELGVGRRRLGKHAKSEHADPASKLPWCWQHIVGKHDNSSAGGRIGCLGIKVGIAEAFTKAHYVYPAGYPAVGTAADDEATPPAPNGNSLDPLPTEYSAKAATGGGEARGVLRHFVAIYDKHKGPRRCLRNDK